MGHYEIILIESFDVDRDGNLIITAILENMGNCTVRQSHLDPPEYAPARCKTLIYPEALPDDIEFVGKNAEELEDLVNRYSLLVNQEWERVRVDNSDHDFDEYCPGGSSRYF
jgi:hypothetical protein